MANLLRQATEKVMAIHGTNMPQGENNPEYSPVGPGGQADQVRPLGKGQEFGSEILKDAAETP